jgi:Family of unknown function (DUF5677)
MILAGDQGFLSFDVEAIKKDIEKKYPELLQLAHEVNSFIWSYQHTLDINNEELPEVLGGTLYFRSVSHYQGLLLLLERGMLPQSQIMLRALIEALFSLVAISNDNSNAKKILESDEHERKAALIKLNEFRKPQNPNDPDIEFTETKIAKIRTEIECKKTKKLKSIDKANDADMSSWYQTVYALTSFAVHSSPISLESHLVINEDDKKIKEFINEPEIIGANLAILYGVGAMLKAVSSISKILSIDEPVQLKQFNKRLKIIESSAPK